MMPLCVIQSRMGSRRLPGKVLLPIKGVPLIEIAHAKACEAFGSENVVHTIPDGSENVPLHAFLEWGLGANVEVWTGDENDLLGRFLETAEIYRWHPDSVIYRYTPDDHRKDVESMRRVAKGETGIPVELGGEAFTLAQLRIAHSTIADPFQREHITYALFDRHPVLPPAGLWSIDSYPDWEAANA